MSVIKLIIPSAKNKLGHLEERLGHVEEVSDFHETICIEVSFNLHRVSNNESFVERDPHIVLNRHISISPFESSDISISIYREAYRYVATSVCMYVCGSIHDCSAIWREHLYLSSGSMV